MQRTLKPIFSIQLCIVLSLTSALKVYAQFLSRDIFSRLFVRTLFLCVALQRSAGILQNTAKHF